MVTFGNANLPDTTASFAEAGAYILRLTASDGQLSGLDEVTITVNPAPLPNPGLMAHWKFDEASGATAIDSSGNGLHATLKNGPTRTQGKIGGALNFDKVNDFVGAPASY
jgi:hypothetical protein